MRRIFLLILLPTIAFILVFIWYREGLLPVDSIEKKTEVFVVRQGENIAEIASNLEAKNLIRDKVVFYLVVKQLGIEKSIQAGDFRLSRSMNTKEIAQELTHGVVDVWVTIIEGLRKEEIASIIAKNIPISQQQFVELAPEGYLFPDTYLIPKTADEKKIIAIMRSTFNKKLNSKILTQASKNGLTRAQLVAIASMIEREAKTERDMRMVAGVFLNRLKLGMPLQVDATVQYVLGYDSEQKTWWKKNLTPDELKIKSPYNTYINKGLPPGPISNPGLTALSAAANPIKSNYLFYISGSDGAKMHYSETYEEHMNNIRKYL